MRCAAPDGSGVTPPRGRLRLTGAGLVWVVATSVLGLVGWAKGLHPLLLLAYMMAVLIVLNGVFAWVQARRVRTARLPLPPVYAREEVRVGVAVRNMTRRGATVGVTDGDSVWQVSHLPGGHEIACTVRRSFPTRGRLDAGPPVVWSAFPFGFLRYDRSCGAGDAVIVLPAVGAADADRLRRWVTRQVGGEEQSRRVLRRVTSDQTDIRGVRPYRPGDGIRTIHWRSSARRGELMVREYDSAPAPELLLVVEPFLPAHPTPADRDRLEAALSLAATVVRTWCGSFDARVTVAVAGEPSPPRTGIPSEAFAREALAPLAGVEGGPALAAISPTTFGRAPPRAARVLISSRRDSPLAAVLAHATGKPFVTLDPTCDLPWYLPPGKNPTAAPGPGRK